MAGLLVVEVNTLGGDCLRVEVMDTSTALDVKNAVARLCGVPSTCQQLIWGSHILQDTEGVANLVDSHVAGTHGALDAPISLTMAISLDWICEVMHSGSTSEKMRAFEDIMKLGSRGGVTAVRAVIGALLQQDKRIQCKAQSALEYLVSCLRDDLTTIQVMCGMLNEAVCPQHQVAGVQALAASGLIGDPTVVAALCNLIIRSRDRHLLFDAVCALASAAERGDPDAIAAICHCLANPDVNVRLRAAKYLATVADKGNRTAVFALIQCLQDGDEDVAHAAVTALKSAAVQGDVETVALLSACVKNGQGSVHGCAALQALAHVSERGDQEVISLISTHLDDESSNVRYGALRALVVVASRSDLVSIDRITRCLQDADADIRHTAVKALHRIADASNEAAVAALKLCLRDSSDAVRSAAMHALVALTGTTDHAVADNICTNSTASGFWHLPQLHLEPLQHWWSDIQSIFPRCSNVVVAGDTVRATYL